MNKQCKEIWKPIPGFPGYDVSNKGRVRSYFGRQGFGWLVYAEPQSILSPSQKNRRYRQVLLRKDGRSYGKNIGQLAALAFLGPCPQDKELCHNDGDSFNDHLSNLRYDTHRANMHDALVHGVAPIGEKNGRALLTHARAREARERFAAGNISLDALANHFGVHPTTMRDVITGRTYQHAGGPTQRLPNKLKRVSDSDVAEIRQERQGGVPLSRLAARYGVSESCISRIARGERRS